MLSAASLISSGYVEFSSVLKAEDSDSETIGFDLSSVLKFSTDFSSAFLLLISSLTTDLESSPLLIFSFNSDFLPSSSIPAI